jgi:hypothetical protein
MRQEVTSCERLMIEELTYCEGDQGSEVEKEQPSIIVFDSWILEILQKKFVVFKLKLNRN